MKPVELRCSFCGSRTRADLSPFDKGALRSQGHLNRFCATCSAETRWIANEPETRGPARDAEESAAPPSEGRVLLIDDDESIRKVIGKALEMQGYDVETANSARQAITRLAREDYEVVLSDIRMPDFDGKQLFAFLDEHLPECKVRVIFLTGDTGTASTQEFLERTGAPYLTKPIDMPRLLEMVREYVEKYGAAKP